MKKIILFATSLLFCIGIKAQILEATANVTLNGNARKVIIEVNKTTSKVKITASGSSVGYFAVGFNKTSLTMANTYTMIFNSTAGIVEERKLAARGSGVLLSPMASVLSNTIPAGGTVQTVVVERNLVGLSADYLDFSTITSGSKLNILLAQGTRKNLEFHGTSGYSSLELTFNLVTNVDKSTDAPLNISLYPNPTQNTFNVAFDRIFETTTVVILNEQYAPVKTVTFEKLKEFEVSIEDLPQGAYFISIKNDAYSLMDKVIKL